MHKKFNALCKQKMAQNIYTFRQEQMAKMIQKELGALFLTEKAILFSNAFISVTAVYLGRDLSMAKVYLSLSLNRDKEKILKIINYQKNTIKRLLGQRIANKIRKVPDLKFCMDETVMQGARVTALIDQLNIIES
ncbi:30S ribosome-binding factor RbfA [Candidatus Cardinium hertigii]|jgi:ribosome-binding factor A|uniref:Ribosome-binding factor A n=1 Tax=Candidatus Cardinium hertigii TaxID=247481 RepID=A0A3N2QB08_9BACT|nr:30S ribosome-binding factor RbfA [Candidatus Cardinium hertigii]ROT46975.1 30S ribosome-binding factor RbfA [Candidatus Cardinium hertigii]